MRGDPVSLDIGYRSGRELVAFVVPRERVYLAHCRRDRGIITFSAASRQSRKRNVHSASKTKLPLREKTRFALDNSNVGDFTFFVPS